LAGRGERLWLAEKKVFGWQRRKLFLAGSGKSLLLAEDFLKVFVFIKASIAKTPKTMQRKLITQYAK
jgi:hypothetical protein